MLVLMNQCFLLQLNEAAFSLYITLFMSQCGHLLTNGLAYNVNINTYKEQMKRQQVFNFSRFSKLKTYTSIFYDISFQ